MEHSTAEATTPDGDLYRNILIPWQRKLLTKLIQVFGVLGLFAVIPGVYAALQAGIPGIVVLDGLAYAALLPAYLLRERWYVLSATVVVALQLVVGVGLLLTVGVEAASMLWLLAPMLIGNLLLRLRGTVVVFVISLIAMVAVAVLLQREALPWSIPLYAWYAIMGTYVSLAVILTLATRFLMNHLLRGILYEQELNHELDHRVRNNLQLINSLIFLQSCQDNPSGREEALNQLNTRVMAMGAAFAAVNRTDRSFQVILSRMLERLFGEGGSVANDDGTVEVRSHQPTVSISVDTAVPVAIILTEMVRAGSVRQPESMSLSISAHGARDSSVSIHFHRPREPMTPLITDPLSQDIISALTAHVSGFYTETPRGEDIELSLTFRDRPFTAPGGECPQP